MLKGSELVLDYTWQLGGASSPTDFPLVSYWARGEWAWEGAWAQVLEIKVQTPVSHSPIVESHQLHGEKFKNQLDYNALNASWSITVTRLNAAQRSSKGRVRTTLEKQVTKY